MNDAERFMNYLSVATDIKDNATMPEVESAARDFGCYDTGCFNLFNEMNIANQFVLFHDNTAVFYMLKVPGSGKEMLWTTLDQDESRAVLLVLTTEESREMVKGIIESHGTERFLKSFGIASAMFKELFEEAG